MECKAYSQEEVELPAFELWYYSSDDPRPGMPVFEGHLVDCIAEASRIAREFGFTIQPQEWTAYNYEWSDGFGNVLRIE